MRKLINDLQVFIDEVLDGLVRAHPSQVRLLADVPRVLVRANAPVSGNVAIVTGGGLVDLPLSPRLRRTGHR